MHTVSRYQRAQDGACTMHASELLDVQERRQHSSHLTHGEAHEAQDWACHHAGQHSWGHKVVHWVCPQHPQRVCLLRHLHGAQLCRKGAAHPSCTSAGLSEPMQHMGSLAAAREEEFVRQRPGAGAGK